MQENPQMRWAFIHKVYSILCFQWILTFGVCMAISLIHPVREFMGTAAGFYVLLTTIAITFISLILMLGFREHHPWNYVLLLIFTLAMSFMVGAASTQIKGEIILLAAGLTLLVTAGLTLFTFVAAKRGWDFSSLGPFLFCALLLLIAFGVVRIFFPVGKIVNQVFSSIEALVFCGFIVYDTESLIKRFNYDQYIEASISLFLDVMNLFVSLLGALGGGN
ncbi:bi1-like protein [Phtheirospermum japonicum]|uniref:Bi1-like protein n=1 Tax=Phtheirospermum japonicum TaxID=374723 RepID=A0A830BNI9_9LAMI|nr:bi1-like protein [Phtheirospermum japonicum]